MPTLSFPTPLSSVRRRERLRPRPLQDGLAKVEGRVAKMLVNRETGRAAVQRRARSLTDDDGAVHVRVRLVWPLSDSVAPAEALEARHREPADCAMFSAAWEAELDRQSGV